MGAVFAEGSLPSREEYETQHAQIKEKIQTAHEYLIKYNSISSGKSKEGRPGEIIEIDSCQELNTPGATYMLTQDIESDQDTCFHIIANDVTLDCNGYRVTNIGAAFFGVSTYPDHYGATIQNCHFSNFWVSAIGIEGSQQTSIRNNKIDNLAIDSFGISIFDAENTTITGNTIVSDYAGITDMNGVGTVIDGNAVAGEE
jgi:hypothetical protein